MPRSLPLIAPASSCLFALAACGPAYGPVQLPKTMQLRVGGCAPIEGKSHLIGGAPMSSRQPMDAFTYDVTSSAPSVARTRHGTAATRHHSAVFAHAAGTSELAISFTAPETGQRQTRNMTVTVAGEEDEAGRARCAQLAKDLSEEEPAAK